MSVEEDKVRKIASILGPRLGSVPQVAVILGSGLGDVDLGTPSMRLSYGEIPGFPNGAVAGHSGTLTLSGKIAVLRGRAHFYEGYSPEEVVRPVRVMALLGVKALVITNAAGAIAPSFRPGDLMLITDHLNLMGHNPLRGRNLDGLGERFVDLSRAYDPQLLKLALAAALKRKIKVRKGVYAAMPGPTYETPAEVRMLRSMGADAVGMSTVPEVIAAVHAGMRVLGISCLTNRAGASVTHEEVLATTAKARGRVETLLRQILC